MNILMICNKYPFPPHDGGSLASLNMAKGLVKAGNSVDMLAMNTSRHFYGKGINGNKIEGLGRVTGVFVDTSITYRGILRNLIFSSIPYTAERFISGEFEEAIASMIFKKSYDIIQLEGLYLSHYLPAIRRNSDVAVVYRAHNVEHMIWDTLSKRLRKGLRSVYVSNLQKRIKKYEQSFINSYDLLATVTGEDLDILNQLGNRKPAIVAPFGMFQEDFQVNCQSSEADLNLHYIGALDWLPNIESLEWFIKKVWVVIRERHPGMRFYVAGRNANGSLVRFLLKNRVDFVGEVEDSRKFICQAGILVVPLFAGSGIRVRIIEAMFAGKPIVATSSAVSGIPAEHGRHLLIADNGYDFVSNLDKLISDNEYVKRVGLNAREFAVQYYNNLTIAEELTGFYKKSTS